MTVNETTSREARERLVGNLTCRAWLRVVAGTTVVAAMTGVVSGVIDRIYFDDAEYARINLASIKFGIPFYTLLCAAMLVVAVWLVRRRMWWFIENRPASRKELERFAGLPRLVASAQLGAWSSYEVAYLFYVIEIERFAFPRWALAKEIATHFVGFVLATLLSYVLGERAFRPYLRLILPNDVADWPRSMGVTSRLFVAWFTVAGAPLLLIAFTWTSLTARQRDLATSGLILTSLLTVTFGFVAVVIASRTLTGPLRQLQGALRRVAGGDLTVSVEIDEAAELGHLEAGFNHMVTGLRSLASDNDRLHAALRTQLEAVQASRVRIVEAADAERARIERNLHDGAQQRLLSLSFALRGAERAARDAGAEHVEARVHKALGELDGAMSELRELARGIHPAILDEEGLDPALASLVERASVPTQLTTDLPGRLPSPVEVTAYFVAAESLANIAKHAEASGAVIQATAENGTLRLHVADDGSGGANPSRGSGLRGLADRVAALGGELTVDSEPGHGTRVVAVIPCNK